MRIQHLFMGDISIDHASLSGILKANLYDFGRLQWLSAQPGREGTRYGPMTLLGEPNQTEVGPMDITTFEQKIEPQGPPAHLILPYKDIWTLPPATVYTLMLPKSYVATYIELTMLSAGSYEGTWYTGIAPDERLFYYTILHDSPSAFHFEIVAQFKHDEQKYHRTRQDEDVVRCTRRMEDLVDAARQFRISREEFFQLLQAGASFFGALLSSKP